MGRPIPPSPAPSADGMQRQRSTEMPTAVNPSVYYQRATTPQGDMYSYPQPPMQYGTNGLDGGMAYAPMSGFLNPGDMVYSPNVQQQGAMLGASFHGLQYANPQMMPSPYTPERSPAPPTQPTDGPTTRSSQRASRQSSTTKPKIVKTGRVEKKPRRQKNKSASTSLVKPLSEIAKEFPNIPVFDIATFVNRSIETRQAEAAKEKKIKRPLNAFILYRKAYQKVAMAFCGTNLNQSASEFCGDSWRQLESESFRQQFKEWAEIEVRMHKDAHPTYRYVPKKNDGDLDAGNPGNGGGDDDEYLPSKRSARTTTRQKPAEQERKTLEATPELDDGILGMTSQPQPTYQQNPYGTTDCLSNFDMPQDPWFDSQMQSSNLGGNYYAQNGFADQGLWQPTAFQTHAEDLSLPSTFSSTDQAWLNPTMASDDQPCGTIDPRLWADPFAPTWPADGNLDAFTQLEPEQRLFALMPDLDENGAHNAYLRGQADDWNIEQLNETNIDEAFKTSDNVTKSEKS